MTNKVKWGIMGTADIADRAVIPGIQASETGIVHAVASRDADKARQFANKRDIPAAYGSYEQLLEDHTIDAVYIPLPNHLHKEWVIRAAAAGKHVLCEKPLALNAQEAHEMVDSCSRAGVLLAEAFMYRHQPRYERVRQIIASGEIGELRGIHGVFTYSNPDDKTNVRVQKWMGGGSIYDIGCYPISAARLIFDKEPEAVTCHAYFSAEHDGCDMMASGLIEFPDAVALTFDCGMWASFRNSVEVLGSDSRIEIPNAFVGQDELVVHANGNSRVESFPGVNHYTLQADSFGRSLLFGAPVPFEPQDAIHNMRVIDACLLSARERNRITL